MSEEMWKAKYHSPNKPTMILSDEEGSVNLIADMTDQASPENQLAAFKDFQFQQIKARRPDLKLLSDGVRTVNGKKVAYFKFLSQAVDQKVFNYYFFVTADGKILLFTFNCIEKLQKKWEGRADNIVASLLIK